MAKLARSAAASEGAHVALHSAAMTAVLDTIPVSTVAPDHNPAELRQQKQRLLGVQQVVQVEANLGGHVAPMFDTSTVHVPSDADVSFRPLERLRVVVGTAISLHAEGNCKREAAG
jgi:hypothetical protein